MKAPRTYRQGDVLLVEQKIPRSWLPVRQSRVPRDNDRIVLAYGEVTGHAHAITAPESDATLTEAQNARFLLLMSDVELTHEEHGTIDVPAGTYKVIQQEQFVAPERRAEYVLD